MASSTACKVVLATHPASSLLNEVQAEIVGLSKAPVLVGFLANTDPAARKYAEWTSRTCEQNKVNFQLRQVDKENIEEQVLDANKDDAVDGIIIYYPIFNNRQDQYIQQIVDMRKDVEGLSHQYIFNMYQNIRFLDPDQLQKSVLPCTPLAIIKILEFLKIYNTILPYGDRLFGHTVTIVNRSEVVGRPLAALLANDGACVYSVDVTGVQEFSRGKGIKKKRHEIAEKEGWTLQKCLTLSDVVISGVPGETFKIPVEHLRDGAVCINFSSEKVRSAIVSQQRLTMLQNFDPTVKEHASIYVPAIGKVTIAVLMRNLLRVIHNKNLDRDRDADQH